LKPMTARHYAEESFEFMRKLRKRKPWRRRRTVLFDTYAINRNAYITDHAPFGHYERYVIRNFREEWMILRKMRSNGWRPKEGLKRGVIRD
jgi:hypothetical protein